MASVRSFLYPSAREMKANSSSPHPAPARWEGVKHTPVAAARQRCHKRRSQCLGILCRDGWLLCPDAESLRIMSGPTLRVEGTLTAMHEVSEDSPRGRVMNNDGNCTNNNSLSLGVLDLRNLQIFTCATLPMSTNMLSAPSIWMLHSFSHPLVCSVDEVPEVLGNTEVEGRASRRTKSNLPEAADLAVRAVTEPFERGVPFPPPPVMDSSRPIFFSSSFTRSLKETSHACDLSFAISR